MLNSVLIVDDLEADRYIARWSIEENSLAEHVMEAKDGQEALELFANFAETQKKMGPQFPPRLILLDVNMPRMNGFEFLEEFRKQREADPESYQSVIVMMFTTSELKEDKDKALSYDFVKDYLTKPIEGEALQEMIQKHCAL